MKKSNKLATVVAYGGYDGENCLYMTFSPGLPYDKQTKGMPHRNVGVVEVQVQDNYTTYSDYHLLFVGYSSGKTKKLDFSYIYAMRKGRLISIKRVVEDMGYTFVDAVKDENNALIASAKSKLTDKEFAALSGK